MSLDGAVEDKQAAGIADAEKTKANWGKTELIIFSRTKCYYKNNEKNEDVARRRILTEVQYANLEKFLSTYGISEFGEGN